MAFIASINDNAFDRYDLFKNRDKSIFSPNAHLLTGMWTNIEDFDDDAVMLVLGIFGITDINDITKVLNRECEFLVFDYPSYVHPKIHYDRPEDHLSAKNGVVELSRFVSAKDILIDIGPISRIHVGTFYYNDDDAREMV